MAYYNKIKDNLRKEDEFPQDMSWEDMRDGIYEKMGKKEKKRRIIFWWFAPMLIFVGIGVYWLVTSNKVTNTDLRAKKLKENIAKEEVKQHIIASETKTPLGYQTEEVDSATEDMHLNAHAYPIITKNKSNSIATEVHQIETQSEKNDNNDGSKPNSMIETNLLTAESTIPLTDDPAISASSTVTNSNIIKIDPISGINTPSVRSTRTVLPEIEVQSIIPLEKNSQLYFGFTDISLSSGVIFWKTNNLSILNINTEQLKATTTQRALPGFHIALNGNLAVSKHFFINTGLDYQKWFSEFNYSGTKVNSIELKNVIIRVEENLLSGEKSLISGTGYSKVTVDRTLRHRNEENRILLTLSPGFLYNHRKWTFRPSAGLFFVVSKFGKGKTLLNEEIGEYNGAIPQDNGKIQMGFVTSLNAKYTISNRYSIQSMVGFHKFATSINSGNTLSKPTIINLSLGLGIQL